MGRFRKPKVVLEGENAKFFADFRYPEEVRMDAIERSLFGSSKMKQPREISLNGKTVNDDSDCYVIAEIGHNHGGDLETALEMVKVAKQCGADAVKFQKRDNKRLYVSETYCAPYVNENSYGVTYGAHREFLEFGWGEYFDLMQYCREVGITMFATAFDDSSVEFLARLDVPFFKVASGDLKNTPLLKRMAEFGKPMIVSTGGGALLDVRRAVDTILPINPWLCVLQCTASYPAKFDELNLRVIETYRNEFPDVVVGLSSHDNGIVAPIVAYMLGGRVVEKHFTLNHTMKGTDHAFSLEPIGFTKMVRDLKRVREMMGDGYKIPYESEESPIRKMGKGLYAARPIMKGERVFESDMMIRSPAVGVPPYAKDTVIGMIAKRDLGYEAPIFRTDFCEDE